MYQKPSITVKCQISQAFHMGKDTRWHVYEHHKNTKLLLCIIAYMCLCIMHVYAYICYFKVYVDAYKDI